MPKMPNLYVVAFARILTSFMRFRVVLSCNFNALSDKKYELN